MSCKVLFLLPFGFGAVLLGVLSIGDQGPLLKGNAVWCTAVIAGGAATVFVSVRWNRILSAVAASLLGSAFALRALEYALAVDFPLKTRSRAVLVWTAMSALTMVLWTNVVFPRCRGAR